MSTFNEDDVDTVVPRQHVARENGETAIRSEPEERQAVEVPAMRYVLGIGMILAIVALAGVYVLSI